VISHRQHHRSSPAQQPSARTASGGFTLIELMVVIVIIGVLVGLIAPAIFAAVRRAREAAVRVDITDLEKGISSFKLEFGGIAPPSYIKFPTDPADWNTSTYARSRAIIRRIWPQFNFAVNGGDTGLTGELNGAECLVFFLGGVPDSSGGLDGFSKNPSQPFKKGGTRVGPFFNFESGRLTAPDASGNDKAPEYLDPLPGQITPYIYLSSYDGRGYRSEDGTKLKDDTLTTSATPWYTQVGGTKKYKPNSHQIISPGSDNKYGTFGEYDGKNFKSPSIDDEDNITNFTGVRLTP